MWDPEPGLGGVSSSKNAKHHSLEWLGERGCLCALFTLWVWQGTPDCLTPEV